MTSTHRILLTGATGYIGGRLLPALEALGRPLRCLARRPDALRDRVAPETEIVGGDLLDGDSLDRAMAGVDTAYYLVHSMGAHGDYREADLLAARAFGKAARRAGVRRIIYLGGLAHDDGTLSKHLKSRLETGEALRESGVPVLELRASVVIGSGSLSFEMIRALVERLPVMICPRWVSTEAQPIGIDDLLAYLVASADLPGDTNQVFEVGGADRASYGDLMREYARQRGLRRLMISVPLLTPHLSSLWLGLVTPIYARIGRQLIEGLRNRSVVRNHAADAAFAVRPIGLADAVSRAIRNEDRDFALTRWSDALQSGGGPRPLVSARFGSRLIDARTVHVDVPPSRAFRPIARIGGPPRDAPRLHGDIELLGGGGHETTRNTIAGGVRALLEHPDQAAVLAARPAEVIETAVEEILRWVSPVIQFARTATADVEVGGETIRRGDTVVLWYPSGNRDEREFRDPYRFDVRRTPNTHLPFGQGEHFCLGANLARWELRSTFRALAPHVAHLELAGPPERLPGLHVGAVAHLPVRWTG